MEKRLREAFNAVWTPEMYRRFREDLDRRCGGKIPFPVAETPMFFGVETLDRFARAAEEILDLLRDPGFLARMEPAVPEAYARGDRGPLPQFAAIDFAVVEEPDGSLAPRVVELQGFPSLYGFQIMIADCWATHMAGRPGLPEQWRLFFHDRNRHQALALLRRAMCGEHAPEEVVLLDLWPDRQKTWPDFSVTRQWFGVEPVCPTTVIREGRRLFREREGKKVPIERIYQRVVPDELERSGTAIPFGLGDDLDVEWAPHPAWYFLWSKYSLPFLDHPAVPRTTRLCDLREVPDDLCRYVLKPLFSFAGKGVKVDVTPEDVAQVPADQRDGWVLQEKVAYAPRLVAPEGFGVKAEVRCMFVRPDDEARPILLMNLLRLSRGKMIGVDFNKDMPWTGSSVMLWTAGV